MSKTKSLSKKLKVQATTDPLTGLANRRKITELLEEGLNEIANNSKEIGKATKLILPAVGFEPTPPKRLDLKSSALDQLRQRGFLVFDFNYF